MKSPAGTVTLVPKAAVINHTAIDTGNAKKMPVDSHTKPKINQNEI